MDYRSGSRTFLVFFGTKHPLEDCRLFTGGECHGRTCNLYTLACDRYNLRLRMYLAADVCDWLVHPNPRSHCAIGVGYCAHSLPDCWPDIAGWRWRIGSKSLSPPEVAKLMICHQNHRPRHLF